MHKKTKQGLNGTSAASPVQTGRPLPAAAESPTEGREARTDRPASRASRPEAGLCLLRVEGLTDVPALPRWPPFSPQRPECHCLCVSSYRLFWSLSPASGNPHAVVIFLTLVTFPCQPLSQPLWSISSLENCSLRLFFILKLDP